LQQALINNKDIFKINLKSEVNFNYIFIKKLITEEYFIFIMYVYKNM